MNKTNVPSKVDMVALAKATVLDENGESVLIASLWQKQTAIFIFLRHFACIGCRSHAQDVWRDRAKYEGSGAKIYFIGNGEASAIHQFKEDLGIQEAPVYTDPGLVSFKAAGFKRGFLTALGPRSIANGLKMFTKGDRQAAYTKESGDLWQLGGIVVMRPDGRLAYHYISEAMGDFPPENDVVK